MNYIDVKAAAEKWNLSQRSVRNYCKEGRIIGAKLVGKKWLIPHDACAPINKNNRIRSNQVLTTLLQEYKNKIKGGLYHKTQIDFSYNSNHIEGSKLTHEQTRYIYETHSIGLVDNQTININDIIEILNHFKCFDFMLNSLNKKLDEKLIKTLHKILKQNTSDSMLDWFNVGQYKIKPNYIGDQKTTAPEDVNFEISKLINWYSSIKNISLNDIIEFHVKFESIHPFQDGNGRVGRLIMFRECIKHNIVPFIITDDVKLFYYRGIKEFKHQPGYLIDTCLKCQDDYKKILDYLRIKY